MAVPQSTMRDREKELAFEKVMIHAIQIVCDEGGSVRVASEAAYSLHAALADEIASQDRGSVKPVPRVRLNNAVLKSTYFS